MTPQWEMRGVVLFVPQLQVFFAFSNLYQKNAVRFHASAWPPTSADWKGFGQEGMQLLLLLESILLCKYKVECRNEQFIETRHCRKDLDVTDIAPHSPFADSAMSAIARKVTQCSALSEDLLPDQDDMEALYTAAVAACPWRMCKEHVHQSCTKRLCCCYQREGEVFGTGPKWCNLILVPRFLHRKSSFSFPTSTKTQSALVL